MFTIIVFFVVLGALVFVHELGHFVVARFCGVKVFEFGFGFPPRLFGVQKIADKKYKFILGEPKETAPAVEPAGDTIYSFNWIPLGGFVKIKGEDATGPDANDADSFASKSPVKKSAILVAGVFMNILLAFVLLSVGYGIGIPQSAESGEAITGGKLQIVEVLPGKPAEAAGFKVGDQILKAGELANIHVVDFQNYVDTHKNEELSVGIIRAGEPLTLKVKPVLIPETGKGGIGIAIAEVGLVKYPWHLAIYHGFFATLFYLKEIILAFFFLIKGIFSGNGVGGAVSGPVGVAVMTGQVAKMGISYLIQFAAMLSLNLAVLNILPIPSLDGGRLLFVWINKFFGKRMAPKFEQITHATGFWLLMLLVVVVTVRDLGSFKNVFVNFFHRLF